MSCIGEPYKIEVDPEVTPIVATHRRCPVAKTEAIKGKLQEMENQQIIPRVEEATPWVSNMVAVECNNKLRLCIDQVYIRSTKPYRGITSSSLQSRKCYPS